MRTPLPSHDDARAALKHAHKKENARCSDEVAIEAPRQSNRDFRRAVLMLEASCVQNFMPSLPTQLTDWESRAHQLASEIACEQSLQKLISARDKPHGLLINFMPADAVLKTLAIESCKNLDEELKHKVVEAAAFHQHMIVLVQRNLSFRGTHCKEHGCS